MYFRTCAIRVIAGPFSASVFVATARPTKHVAPILYPATYHITETNRQRYTNTLES